MKKIAVLVTTILMVVCFSFKTNAQDIKKDLFEGDKGYHFISSSAGALTINYLSFKFLSKRDVFNNRLKTEIASGLISFFTMTAVGVGKEFCDKKFRNGVFSKDDLRADMWGSFSGSMLMITFRVSISGIKKRK